MQASRPTISRRQKTTCCVVLSFYRNAAASCATDYKSWAGESTIYDFDSELAFGTWALSAVFENSLPLRHNDQGKTACAKWRMNANGVTMRRPVRAARAAFQWA